MEITANTKFVTTIGTIGIIVGIVIGITGYSVVHQSAVNYKIELLNRSLEYNSALTRELSERQKETNAHLLNIGEK